VAVASSGPVGCRQSAAPARCAPVGQVGLQGRHGGRSLRRGRRGRRRRPHRRAGRCVAAAVPLRHSAITFALDAGAALRDVQDYAGHKDPRTTRRYDHSRDSLDRNAAYTVAAYLA